MISLLQSLGCRVNWSGEGIIVDSSRANACGMSGESITGMRSSLCLLGAMLGRFGEVVMEHPGGCVIGERPIDLHLHALEKMGVAFSEEDGRLKGCAGRLTGADIHFAIPSVGATENVLLAAVLADGDTVITGAAREPEVVALCRYLAACGAQIEGTGGSTLRIKGGQLLHGAEFVVPPDRIVAGTYLFACVGTAGRVLLENVPCTQLQAVLRVAESMGAKCQQGGEPGHEDGAGGEREGWMYVQGPERPKAVGGLRTAVYPGFPTDLQSMALAVLTCGDGESRIEENIFENRFRVVEPLGKMGADIELLSRNAVLVRGVEKLSGARLEAQELRGGAALVLAGLMAEGESEIGGCAYIERGYENIGKDLRDLGARIVSV
jgi:UDP-N-acetylglucosamine 1-carboxyvinyltransferase